ncbi:MAG: GTPase ObgE [Actinomycetota bacterium]
MAFTDEATLFVRGGEGGKGSASFRREPYKPRGGVDGGDGGRGGSVILEVSERVHDLSWPANHPHQRAEPGKPGASNKRRGAEGSDVVLQVPSGTVVRDERGVVGDLVGEGTSLVVAEGGRGGRGNASLSGRKNRAPRTAEPGETGEERRLELELRVVADVGLVGLPSAGKSTLLSKLTAAKPKIAAYPFTTLAPNLGITEGEARVVVADLPGLIEGAHEGKGLGHRFLRHVMRCRVLVLVVDLSSPDPAGDLQTVNEELAAYDPTLVSRPSIVAATKSDLTEDPAAGAKGLHGDVCIVSGVTGEGVEELASRIYALASEAPAPPDESYVVLRPGKPEFEIRREGKAFRVTGRSVERWVNDTDFEDERSIISLQKRLLDEGVEARLAELGARPGDEVVIGDRAFAFVPEGGS